MSYLLGRPKQNRVPQAGGLNRNIIGRTTVHGRLQPTRGGVQMQQQLVQRQHQAPQTGLLRNTTRQYIGHAKQQQQQVTRVMAAPQQQQKQQHQNAAKIQGVISMEEVMEDLRVLEQQQRDSQRKLETIKLTKKHKLEQRDALENELASLTYSNGEKRAQLLRCREVLSQCTRELGTAKLRTSKAGESLKAFDDKLKKALALAGTLHVWRRKLDAKFVRVRQSEAQLIQKNAELKKRIKVAEVQCAEAKNREQLIRKSIQDKRTRTKQLREETAALKAECCGLDQDLATSHELEASTKLRVEGIMQEISAEENRHDEAMKATQAKREECETKIAEQRTKQEALVLETQEKKKVLHDTWARCIQIQREEGHEESPGPADGQSPPSLNLSRMRVELAAVEEGLDADTKKGNTLQASATDSRREISNLEKEGLEVSRELRGLLQSAEKAEKVEHDRRQVHEEFQSNLEKVRHEVEELRRSKMELEEAIAQSNGKAAEKLSLQQEALKRSKAALVDERTQLSAETTNVEEAEKSLQQQKAENAAKMEVAKERVKEAKTVFEQLKVEVEELPTVMKGETQEEIDTIKRACSTLVGDMNSDISLMREQCPSLSEIELVNYDPSKSSDELAQEALAELSAECESRVETARKNRESRLRALKQECRRRRQARKKELKEAERRRKEQEEEQRRARLEREAQAEAKREEEAQRKRRVERKRRADAEKGQKRQRERGIEGEKMEEGKDFEDSHVTRKERLRSNEGTVASTKKVAKYGQKYRKRREEEDGEENRYDESRKKRRMTFKGDSGRSSVASSNHRDGKSTRKQKSLPLHKGRTGGVEAKRTALASRQGRDTLASGSQRRVSFGGLDDGFSSQTHSFDADDAGHAGGSSGVLDEVLTQPPYPGVLTQLSQDDPRNEVVKTPFTSTKSLPSERESPAARAEPKPRRIKEPSYSGDVLTQLSQDDPRYEPVRTPLTSVKAVPREKSVTRKAEPKAKHQSRSSHRSSRSVHESTRKSISDIEAADRSRKRTKTSSGVGEKNQTKVPSRKDHHSHKPTARVSHSRLPTLAGRPKTKRESSVKRQKTTPASRKSTSRIEERSSKGASRQPSGISSMERSSNAKVSQGKSRRRKKKEGVPASKKRSQSLGAMNDDYDFHF